MWLARDRDNTLWFYPYGNKPTRLQNSGHFNPNINIDELASLSKISSEKMNPFFRCIRIFETDDRYKDITWENSPVELNYKL